MWQNCANLSAGTGSATVQRKAANLSNSDALAVDVAFLLEAKILRSTHKHMLDISLINAELWICLSTSCSHHVFAYLILEDCIVFPFLCP